MTKLIKEAKRFQELAGINEVKIQPNTPLENIFKEYVKEAETQLKNFDEDEQDEIQQYINEIDKNISSVGELAEKIKQIDDFMTNDMSGAYIGEFYEDTVVGPLIEDIFPKLRLPESKIKEILDTLDNLYDRINDGWDPAYQLYLDSK
jgi:hypothetical protein